MDRQTDNQQPKIDEDIGWLAGLFDGEGTCIFQVQHNGVHNRISPAVNICNTNWEILDRATRILTSLGIGHFVQWRESKKRDGTFSRWCWELTIAGFKRASKFAVTFLEHVTGKKKQIELILEFIASREGKGTSLDAKGKLAGAIPYSPQEWDMVKRMHELNSHPSIGSETTRFTRMLSS